MPNTKAELFIVVGCEELPARLIEAAISQLEKNILNLVKNIEHGEVKTWTTPRRIAIAISELASQSPVEEKLVTGPPADRAFKDGEPTKAAIGFAKGKGVSVDSIEIVDGPKGKVIGVRLKSGGESVIERIQKGLEEAILDIEFDRSMKWGSQKIRWARPLHRVIALYNGEIIPATVGNIQTANVDAGHRLSEASITVSSSTEWVSKLEEKWVIVDTKKRKQICKNQLNALAKKYSATIKDWDLLEEVNNLVEWPVTIACHFPEELLDLPPRLLVEAMKLHQRVFPLYDQEGKLLSSFLAVTNHPYATDPEVAQIIAEGNKRVLTARFYDAKFFYAEDRKKSLIEHGKKLETMRWVRNGGMVSDKVARLMELAEIWAPKFGADVEQTKRAAQLCKCDLATQMVYEFPKLQGHVGNLMARYEGEEKNVAQAIEEHYLPKGSDDDLPQTKEGLALAFIDRLDTLQQCFTLGLQPKGSGDPLGLRRAAIGLLSISLKAQKDLHLISTHIKDHQETFSPLEKYLQLKTLLEKNAATSWRENLLKKEFEELRTLFFLRKSDDDLEDFLDIDSSLNFERALGLQKELSNEELDQLKISFKQGKQLSLEEFLTMEGYQTLGEYLDLRKSLATVRTNNENREKREKRVILEEHLRFEDYLSLKGYMTRIKYDVIAQGVFLDGSPSLQFEISNFLLSRISAQFSDEFGGDIFNAVINPIMDAGNIFIYSPQKIYHCCKALRALTSSHSFPETRSTFKRLMGLTKEHFQTDYNPNLFVDEAEKRLHNHFQEISETISPLEGRNDYAAVLEELIKLKPSIDSLFDSVMVMDSNLELRNNRLGLLRSISRRFLNIADFTFIN